MATCTACGAPSAYNSGFSLECVNKQCSFFSQRQWDDTVGKEPFSVLTFGSNDLRVTSVKDVNYILLTVKSGTVNVRVEQADEDEWRHTCQAADVVRSTSCGKPFHLYVGMWNPESPESHEVLVEMLDSLGICLYSNSHILRRGLSLSHLAFSTI